MPTLPHPTSRRCPDRRRRVVIAIAVTTAGTGLAATTATAGPSSLREEHRERRTEAIRASIESSASSASSASSPRGRRLADVAPGGLRPDEDAPGTVITTDGLLRNERGLEIEVVAGAWLARLGGEVSLGEGGTVFRIDRRIRNDDLEVTPLVEFSFLDDEGFVAWRLHGFDFSSEGSGRAVSPLVFGGLSFAAGDEYETRTDFSSAGAEHVIHRWTAVDPRDSEGPGVGRGDARLDVSTIGGVRWIAVDQRITRPGVGTEAPNADWLAAYLAARFDFTWAPAGGFVVGRSFRITGEYGIGAGLNRGGGSLWHVRAGAELEFTDSIRGYFGYRLLELGLESGDWEFDSGLQGLFVGATIQF